MHAPSLLLLIGAAGMVAIFHSILPDHWVPLAIVARTQRWSLLRVGRITFLASLGHVIASLILGGIIALIGLQFQQQIDSQQGHIVGAILILTGLAVFVWDRFGSGPHGHKHGSDQSHNHGSHSEHEHDHDHDHEHGQKSKQPLLKKLAAIAVPFGVAASPDLTILPVALAAGAVGKMEVVTVLGVFAVVTIATFMGLTIIATMAGYQVKGAWVEKRATAITSLVLVAIGIVAFVGL